MRVIDKLEYEEPVPCIELHIGTFTYNDVTGEATVAEFYIKTCEFDEDNPDTQSRREDDLNEQLTAQWSALMSCGCKDIKYTEIRPNPIF